MKTYPVEVIAKAPSGELVTLYRVGGGAHEDLGDHYYPTCLWFRKDRCRVSRYGVEPSGALYFSPDECGYTHERVVTTWQSDDPMDAAGRWPILPMTAPAF